jgi:tetratricopeptide (TPR) repeat protein
MWYLKFSVRAFSTLLLSVILLLLLGRNQYAYEHAAIFLESAASRPRVEALITIALCGAYLLVLGWTLSTTMISALAATHDVNTTSRVGFALLLAIAAGGLPLLGMLNTLYVVRHTYIATGSAFDLASLCWYGLLVILGAFLLGAALVGFFAVRAKRFPKFFRSRTLLICLFIPVALAFASIYLGALVSVGGLVFGGMQQVFPAHSFGLPSLVDRFGLITYLVVFVTMFVLLTRIVQREGRAFDQSVVVILIGLALLSYLVKSGGSYPVSLYTDKETEAYLQKHDAARRSQEYRANYRQRWNEVSSKTLESAVASKVKLPVLDPALRMESVLRARGIPPLSTAFAAWLKKRAEGRDASGEDRDFPVFIVAAQGGGYYAAYHSALTLARLQDLCPDFRNQTFAISGVSGGSLGASVFTAISDNIPTDLRQQPCVGSSSSHRYETVVKEFFRQDLLSPLLATLLYVDLPASLLPFPNRLFPFHPVPYNRVNALESSFEDAFEAAKEPAWSNPMRGAFFTRWDAARATPSLVLNGTLVWRSTPFLVSQLYFSGKTLDRSLDRLVSDSLKKKLEDHFQMDMEAILEDPDKKRYAYEQLNKELSEDETRRIVGGEEYFDSLHLLEYAPDVNLKTSSAVTISARFPYITPTALVSGRSLASQEQMRLGSSIQVVDGAYWDNSGLRTALDMVSELEANKAIWQMPGVRVTFHILSIGDVTPEKPNGLDLAKGAPEILAPLQTMMEVRGRAQQGSWFSVLRAKKEPVRFSLFDVKFSAPLDWSASAITRASIEQRSGYPHLTLSDQDRVCCNARGNYYPNWTSERQVVNLLQTTWSPAGAREACAQTADDPDKKIEACTKLIANNPNDAETYERRAVAYANKKDFDHAIADAKKLIELDPRITRYYDFAGRLYLSKGEANEAVAEFTKAIEIEPRRATYYHKRATARLRASDYANALKDDETNVEITTLDETSSKGQPGRNTAVALGNLAWSAVVARSYSEALDAAERATSLAPDLLWLKGNLAHALLFAGRIDEAKQIYLANKGKVLRGNELWDSAIHNDFAFLRAAGVLEPAVGSSMADIDLALTSSAPPPNP